MRGALVRACSREWGRVVNRRSVLGPAVAVLAASVLLSACGSGSKAPASSSGSPASDRPSPRSSCRGVRRPPQYGHAASRRAKGAHAARQRRHGSRDRREPSLRRPHDSEDGRLPLRAVRASVATRGSDSRGRHDQVRLEDLPRAPFAAAYARPVHVSISAERVGSRCPCMKPEQTRAGIEACVACPTSASTGRRCAARVMCETFDGERGARRARRSR